VYRAARGIAELAEILQRAGGDAPVPAGLLTSLLELLGIRELSQSAALEELARVFDRKRSQIVAMWFVENAVSPWEKVPLFWCDFCSFHFFTNILIWCYRFWSGSVNSILCVKR